MSEAWLQFGGEQSAARLLLKQVSAGRGVGIGQLLITVEAAGRKAVVDGRPIWLNGTVEVTNVGLANGHLGVLRNQIQPITLPDRGGSRDVTFICDVSYAQLQAIENHRTGPIRLRLDFSGYSFLDDGPVPFWNCQLEHEVKQSDWIAILEQTGYRRILLLELEAPDALRSPAMAVAVQFFVDAQEHYLEHDWRLTTESLRQCLAALVGKQPDDEDEEMDVRASLKDARKESRTHGLGYGARHEPVRVALKFLCDLGAHPEVAETQRQHAYGSLLMVAGLLQGFGRP